MDSVIKMLLQDFNDYFKNFEEKFNKSDYESTIFCYSRMYALYDRYIQNEQFVEFRRNNPEVYTELMNDVETAKAMLIRQLKKGD